MMKLIASDIDGTILSHPGGISDRTVAAFHAAMKSGVELVFVTGRPLRWLSPLRGKLDYQGTVICSNGAVVYDLTSQQVLSYKEIELEKILSVCESIRQLLPQVGFAAEALDGFHIEPGFFLEAQEKEVSSDLAEIELAPLASTLNADSRVIKLLAVDHEGNPDEFMKRVQDAVGELVEVTHSSPTRALIEMSALGVNKAITLEQYANSLGIDRADVVVFGDMPNDVPMLRWAGMGYAMSCGHPQAIEVADRIAPALAEDGVAQILEELLGLNEKLEL